MGWDLSRDLLWISTIVLVGRGWDFGGMGLGGVYEKVFLSMVYVSQLVVGSWLEGFVGSYGVRCNFWGIYCNFTLSYRTKKCFCIHIRSRDRNRYDRNSILPVPIFCNEFMHCNRYTIVYIYIIWDIRSYTRYMRIYITRYFWICSAFLHVSIVHMNIDAYIFLF